MDVLGVPAEYWWNSFCSEPPFDPVNWDIRPCTQATTLSLIPTLVLFIVGGHAFPGLWRRYRSGETRQLSRQGKAAYGLKLALLAALVLVQVGYLIVVAVEAYRAGRGGLSVFSDARFPFALVGLVAYLFAHALLTASHPLLRHSSTPLLWWSLLAILYNLVGLRSALIAPVHPHALHGTSLALFIFLVVRLSLLGSFFALELLGPQGWEGMGWRDFVPFVEPQGKIRLSEEGDAIREGAAVEGDGEVWEQPECPRLTANIFQRLTFSWMTPMMKMGYKKFLTEEDLWSLPPDDTAHALSERLERAWAARCARVAHKTHNEPVTSAQVPAYSVVPADGKASKKTKRPSLFGALMSAYGGPFLVAAVFKLLQDCLSFTQPQLLKRLLRFVSTYNTPDAEPAFHGYTIAFAMFVCAVTQTILLHCYFARVFETGMRFRGGLISLIYKKGPFALFHPFVFSKILTCFFSLLYPVVAVARLSLALVLSPAERGGRMTGDIVNLQSTDATRLNDVTTSGVFQITLAFISLYGLLGWSMFVGVAVMIASIPLTGMIARYVGNLQRKTIVTRRLMDWGRRYQTKLQRRQMKNKDQRTSIMSEILNNIRSIKLYAWENSFAQRLFDVRNNQELQLLKKMGYLSAASNYLWSFTPFAVAFSSFAVYAMFSGQPLTSEIVFPAITLFQLLSPSRRVLLPRRVLRVPRSSHRFPHGQRAPGRRRDDRHPAPRAQAWRRARFGRSPAGAEVENTLEDISLSVKKGELIAVVGKVGAGKSSLLSAVLGEMNKIDGHVTVRGSVAYCAQQPWIMGVSCLLPFFVSSTFLTTSKFLVGGTVKSNITFGYKFEKEFYDLVIEACALKEDLNILPNGDETEVGERGISLSGGQKARVALARAVYARADIYLLDDPLSAVDAHVGRHLFDRVIGPTGLLKDKARLLCTNAIPFCEQADELIFLRRGVILERGTYSSAIQGDTELSRLLLEFGKSADKDDSDSDTAAESGSGDETIAVVEPEQDEAKLDAEDLAVKLKLEKSTALMHRAIPVPVDQQKLETLKMLKRSTRPQEKREQGSVKWSVYKEYIAANGYIGVFLYIFTIVLQQVLNIAKDVWLKQWSQHNAETGDNGNVFFYLTIYGIIGSSASIAMFINGILLYSLCVIRSAKIMHDRMFNAVIRSPMLFFETTPLGTILNRFSRDIDVIDSALARVFGGFFRTLAGVFGMVAVISSSAPAFLLILAPVLFIYKRIQTYYLATSRELKRLDATTKSPIFASFQETLGGVSTIRAYRQMQRFIAENEARVDRNQEAFFPSINCNRWLAVRLEFLGSIIIVSTAVLAVFTLVQTNNVNAGVVGLMLSYALSTTQTLNWIVRSATEVETNIVSVERVQEYITLPSEAPLEIPDKKPAEEWPQAGSIKFDHVAARYRQGLDLVLKDVSFEIKGGEKVGGKGRMLTLAGPEQSLRSNRCRKEFPDDGAPFALPDSLSMVLYRVIEAESGTVSIDGVDVRQIGLHDLRSRLSIIPQDSQCFEGTLRANLDPSGQSSDAQLWAALEQCRLKEHVESMDGKLDAKIDEGGSNLSSGQRQLMCLGVLDEATAAVDVESDREIQLIIRKEFAAATTFTIAHRINTILDSDKVLVMDKGRVAEFDSPAALLQRKDSIFYSLALEAGLIRSGANTPRSGARTPRSGMMTPARRD
ncbi:SPOSA6832_02085, partial [Sporobolomyces salmonicolor]